MTRALIADPELPAKARDGRLGARSPAASAARPASPTTTPARRSGARSPRVPGASGRGLRPCRRRHARRLVVVGAGPAGLAAAAEAAAAGHEVVVLERTERVGGQLALAAVAPAAAASPPRSSPTSRGMLEAVDLRLGSEATAETVAALAPDAVVVATGARPYSAAAAARRAARRAGLGRAGRSRRPWPGPSWSRTGAATRPGSTPPRCSPAPATG